MRLPATAALVALIASCGGSTPTPKDTAPADADTDTDADADTDTETGTDADGDGWTVEDGDCDDGDIWVNPGWPEDTHDGIDNDCDGKIDEVFSGLAVLDMDQTTGVTFLTTISDFGDHTGTTELSFPVGPYWYPYAFAPGLFWVTEDTEPGVMIANDMAYLSRIEPDGQVEIIADLGAIKLPKGVGGYGLYGVATHPDGFYLLNAVNALIRVEPSGDWSVAVTWPMDLSGKGPHDLAPIAVSVDPLTREAGMLSIDGGFATWHPEDGYTLHKAGDLYYGTPYVWNMESADQGGFFGIGWDETGSVAFFRWNEAVQDITNKAAWPNADFTPFEFSIDGGTGDFYGAANGGWYQTVWRVYEDGTGGSQLYTTDGTDDSSRYMGITTLWTEGG